MTGNIVVQRTGALGDVILVTPIVRFLSVMFPSMKIHVRTGYPDVFKDNPYVERCWAPNAPELRDAKNWGTEYASLGDMAEGDWLIDLDLAYERRPSMHIVNAYMEQSCFHLAHNHGLQQEFFYGGKPIPMRRHSSLVAVHAGRAGWRNRTLPSATWRVVCEKLTALGLKPVLVGTDHDSLPGSNFTKFHYPDIRAQARFIAGCACFVGPDSALLHAAGTTDVSIVGVFTCARPEYRLPYRGGVLGKDCVAVVPPLDCVGCLERQPAPATDETCERGDIACVRSVDPEAIVAAIEQLLNHNKGS